MKKEQIKERTFRIFTVALDMGNDLGQMSQFLVNRISTGEKPTTVLEEEFIVRFTAQSKRINDLVNENVKGKARISGAEDVCKEMNSLKKDFKDFYGKEIKESDLEKIVGKYHVVRNNKTAKA